MLVLTVGLNVLSNSEAGAFSCAAALTSMIYALGSCSGAHFNPAVTFAIVFRGAIGLTEAIHYVGTQITAGIMGAFTFYLLMDNKTFQLKPDTYRWDKVLGVEFVFTFLLCFVVLSAATVKKPLSEYFGFAIGMCVAVGGIAVGTVSRAPLNPAVSIGISSAYIPNGGVFWPCVVYSSIEILAALAAAMAFRLTQPSEHLDDEETKPLTVANGDKASGYLKDVEAPAEGK
jgi:aquaporin Z